MKDYKRLAAERVLTYEIMDYAFPIYNEPEVLKAYEGMKIPSMHAPFIDINYASNDPIIMEVSRKRVKSSIFKGIELGVENVVLHTCFYPVLGDTVLNELWCDNAAAFIKEITDECAVNIFVENTLDLEPDILLMLMSKTSRDRVNICFDVGHANLSYFPVSKWVDSLHPYIKYMHVNDNHGKYDQHLPLGDGTVDWSALIDQMHKYSIDPIITFEVAGFDKINKSLDFWEKIERN